MKVIALQSGSNGLYVAAILVEYNGDSQILPNGQDSESVNRKRRTQAFRPR